MGELNQTTYGLSEKAHSHQPLLCPPEPSSEVLVKCRCLFRVRGESTWEQFIHLGSGLVVSLLSGTDLSSSFPPTAAAVVVLCKTFLLSLPHAMVLTSYLSSLLTSTGCHELLQVEQMFFKVTKSASQSPSIPLCFCKPRAPQLKRRARGDRELSTANLKVMLQPTPRGRSQHAQCTGHRCPSPRHFPVSFPHF